MSVESDGAFVPDITVFCERCAQLTRTLEFSPSAEPHPELLSGSCIWFADEWFHGWCSACIGNVRQLFNLRYRITVGEAVPPASSDFLLRLAQQFPNWPFFRPERSAPEIASQIRHLVRRSIRKCLVDAERWEREKGTQGKVMPDASSASDSAEHGRQDA